MAASVRMPAVFIAHAAPLLAIEQDDLSATLRRLGQGLPRPTAIVVVSAHWEAAGPVRVTGSASPELIYDFSGFPEELYAIRYPSPGGPAMAGEIVGLLAKAGIAAEVDAQRGLDHGAWVPLLHAYPKAEIPVLQVTLPVPRSPSDLLRIGSALSPLRDRGILLLGSGGVVHNLSRVHFGNKAAPVDGWAQDFDDWVDARLSSMDLAGLESYRSKGPNAALAVPTSEHFDPLFVVLGSRQPAERASVLLRGFHYGNLSLLSFSLS